MLTRFRVTSRRAFDPTTVARVEEVFAGENLVQVILHAHLLVERALIKQLAKKFRRPSIVDGKDAKWTFAELASLYMGLCDPSLDDERALRGINKLRNTIAHQLQFDAASVAACLPWDGWDGAQHTEPPDPLTHVKVVAMSLLFKLEAIDSVRRLEPDPAGHR